MELTMTNNFGFCELNENEKNQIDGGFFPTVPIYLGVRTGIYLGNMYNYNMQVSSINGYNDTVISAGRSDLVKSYPEKPRW